MNSILIKSIFAVAVLGAFPPFFAELVTERHSVVPQEVPSHIPRPSRVTSEAAGKGIAAQAARAAIEGKASAPGLSFR